MPMTMKSNERSIIMTIGLKLPLFVEKKMHVHENGWPEGDTEYYNKNICKYHVSFNDGTEDCITEDDIDMIEVIVF